MGNGSIAPLILNFVAWLRQGFSLSPTLFYHPPARRNPAPGSRSVSNLTGPIDNLEFLIIQRKMNLNVRKCNILMLAAMLMKEEVFRAVMSDW
jgi:hypothetical protein